MDIFDSFGCLVVISDRFYRFNPNGRKMPYRLVRCKCGKEYETCEWNLTKTNGNESCWDCAGPSISSGKVSHGDSKRGQKTRLYECWTCMKKRCYNAKNKDYPNYGGRGIKVCAEWKESYPAFKTWALTSGYQDRLEIDRRNYNGDYEPGNCRWATDVEQANNRRPRSTVSR